MASPVSNRFGVAVHALTLLSAGPQPLASSELLASSIGATPVHVRRVLTALAAAGLVRSRPGPGGGWELAREPERITLRDAHDAVGASVTLGLHEPAPECPAGRRIESALGDLEARTAALMLAELERTTVADLLASAGVDASWRQATPA